MRSPRPFHAPIARNVRILALRRRRHARPVVFRAQHGAYMPVAPGDRWARLIDFACGLLLCLAVYLLISGAMWLIQAVTP